MSANILIKNLQEAPEVVEIMDKFGLSSCWCDDAVFLFSKSSAILVSDLVHEYEADVQVYDRASRGITFNLYGIANCIVGLDRRASLEQPVEEYFRSLDFEKINLRTERKRRSLCFALAFINLYGDKIFVGSPSVEFPNFFTVVTDLVSKKWEGCMDCS